MLYQLRKSIARLFNPGLPEFSVGSIATMLGIIRRILGQKLPFGVRS